MNRSPLTVQQQYQLLEYAALGMSCFDCLVCCGISPADADELQRDIGITALWRDGKAHGIRDIRSALAREARNGNVSAMKALRLTDPDYAQDDDVPRPAPVRVDVLKSVNEAFERQRRLMEQFDAEQAANG